MPNAHNDRSRREFLFIVLPVLAIMSLAFVGFYAFLIGVTAYTLIFAINPMFHLMRLCCLDEPHWRYVFWMNHWKEKISD